MGHEQSKEGADANTNNTGASAPITGNAWLRNAGGLDVNKATGPAGNQSNNSSKSRIVDSTSSSSAGSTASRNSQQSSVGGAGSNTGGGGNNNNNNANNSNNNNNNGSNTNSPGEMMFPNNNNNNNSGRDLLSGNPLIGASVVDAGRNRVIPFASSSAEFRLDSAVASATSSRASSRAPSKRGSLAVSIASSSGSNTGNSNNNTSSNTNNNSNNNNNNNNNGGGAADSEEATTPVVSPTTDEGHGGDVGNKSPFALGSTSPLSTSLSPRSAATAHGRAIQPLPNFGFLSGVGVSGWSNLNEASLENEINAILTSRQQSLVVEGMPPSPTVSGGVVGVVGGTVTDGPYVTPQKNSLDIERMKEAESAHKMGLKVTTSGNMYAYNTNSNGEAWTSSVSAVFGNSSSSTAAISQQVSVPVLSTPRARVLSAMQPLCCEYNNNNNNNSNNSSPQLPGGLSSSSSSPLMRRNNINNNNNNKSSTSDSTPSAPMSPDLLQRMEAAARVRYGVPINYAIVAVGSLPRPIRTVCATGEANQYLVVAHESNTARLIEPERQVLGSSLLDFKGQGDDIIAVAVSRDGRYVVTSGRDCSVTSWDVSNGKRVRDLSVTALVRAVAISDDGELVAGTTGDDNVTIWETRTGDTLSNCSIHTATPTAVTIARRGNIAASGTHTGEICVWQCPSGNVTFRFTVNDRPIRSLAFSFDGGRLLAVDQDTVRIWDTFTGELVFTRYTDDSISLGEEGRIQLVNGSLTASCGAKRGTLGQGGPGAAAAAAAAATAAGVGARPNGGGAQQSGNKRSSKSDAEANASDAAALAAAGITVEVAGPAYTKVQGRKGGGGSSNNSGDKNSMAARDPACDPMDLVFQAGSTIAFTCGGFAACNDIVVGTNTGIILLLEPNTGTELLSLPCRSAIRSLNPGWSGDILYVGDSNGNVYRIKLQYTAKTMQDFNVGTRQTTVKERKSMD